MENIYAAMLLHKAGKQIDEQSITAVLTAAGVTVDAVQVKALVASLVKEPPSERGGRSGGGGL
jgi:large subunit ribosomal protein L12